MQFGITSVYPKCDKKALNAVHPHSKADPYPEVIKIKFLEIAHLGFNFDSVKD